MQSGVRQLVFAHLTAQLAVLNDGWGLILCVRTGQDRTGQSWFSMVQFPLTEANPLPSFISLFSFLFSPSDCLLGSACFCHSLVLSVTTHSAFPFPFSPLSIRSYPAWLTRCVKKRTAAETSAVTRETFCFLKKSSTGMLDS